MKTSLKKKKIWIDNLYCNSVGMWSSFHIDLISWSHLLVSAATFLWKTLGGASQGHACHSRVRRVRMPRDEAGRERREHTPRRFPFFRSRHEWRLSAGGFEEMSKCRSRLHLVGGLATNGCRALPDLISHRSPWSWFLLDRRYCRLRWFSNIELARVPCTSPT